MMTKMKDIADAFYLDEKVTNTDITCYNILQWIFIVKLLRNAGLNVLEIINELITIAYCY